MITQEELKKIISYDAETGDFKWLVRRGASAAPGNVAGTINAKTGYRIIKFKGRAVPGHRLAFLYMTGEIPETVDHINNIRNDNRWINLRPTDRRGNCRNSIRRKDCKSGVKGVCWNKRLKKWIAQINVRGYTEHVGCFPDLIGAELAVRRAREKYHGEFANHG